MAIVLIQQRFLLCFLRPLKLLLQCILLQTRAVFNAYFSFSLVECTSIPRHQRRSISEDIPNFFWLLWIRAFFFFIILAWKSSKHCAWVAALDSWACAASPLALDKSLFSYLKLGCSFLPYPSIACIQFIPFQLSKYVVWNYCTLWLNFLHFTAA